MDSVTCTLRSPNKTTLGLFYLYQRNSPSIYELFRQAGRRHQNKNIRLDIFVLESMTDFILKLDDDCCCCCWSCCCQYVDSTDTRSVYTNKSPSYKNAMCDLLFLHVWHSLFEFHDFSLTRRSVPLTNARNMSLQQKLVWDYWKCIANSDQTIVTTPKIGNT